VSTGELPGLVLHTRAAAANTASTPNNVPASQPFIHSFIRQRYCSDTTTRTL